MGGNERERQTGWEMEAGDEKLRVAFGYIENSRPAWAI